MPLDLADLMDWSVENGFSLNIKKCEVTSFYEGIVKMYALWLFYNQYFMRLETLVRLI